MKIKFTAAKARDIAHQPKLLLKNILQEIKNRANIGESRMFWYGAEFWTNECLMYISSALTDAGFTIRLSTENEEAENEEATFIISW